MPFKNNVTSYCKVHNCGFSFNCCFFTVGKKNKSNNLLKSAKTLTFKVRSEYVTEV